MLAFSLFPKERFMENMDSQRESSISQNRKYSDWKEYTIPSEAHKILDDIVGTFNYSIRMWTDPHANPVEMAGKSANRWILGGRYVEQEITGGSMLGELFAGVGITGYDNFREEYQSIWIDNMSTGIALSTGKAQANERVIEQIGMSSNPMKDNKNYWFKTVVHVISKNEHTYVMYVKDEDDNEFKSMEIKYTRT
jgi:hypothetical protein